MQKNESGCEAWNLVSNPGLSVKLESMPAGTEESIHFHKQTQQFFFVLYGEAEFEVDGKMIRLREREGLHISPLQKHRIMNKSDKELHFLLCSQPSNTDDRFNQE